MSSFASIRRRPGSRARALTGAVLVAACAVTAVTVVSPRTGRSQTLGDLTVLAASLVAAYCCLTAARRGGRAARAWALLAISAAFWGTGQLVWTWYGLTRDHAYPFPSAADIGFLGYAPIAIAAVLIFPRGSTRRFAGRRAVLDAAVVTGSLLLLSSATVLHPLQESGAVGVARVVSTAYPLVDVGLASLVLVLGLRIGRAERRPWLLLQAGLLVLAVTDSVYVAGAAAGQTGSTGSPLVAGWAGAWLLVGAAALAEPRPAGTAQAQFTVPQELLPIVPALAALGVLALDASALERPVVLVLGLVVLAVLAGQQVVVALEKTRLANGLEETVEARTAELRLAEGRVGALVEFADAAIVGKTVDGLVTSWNPAAERLYGFAADEIVGRSVDLIVPPDRRDEERTILAGAAQGRRRARYETERLRKDGSRVEVSLSVSPILDEDGAVMGISAISQDISERKRSEQALRVQQQRTRDIIETATDSFVAMDDHGLITEWNRAAELTFGWARHEAVGRRLSETIIPERFRAAHESGRARVVAGGEPRVLGRQPEVLAQHRDGTELLVELTSWRAEGADGGFNAFLRDITERKRAEEELAAARDQALEGSRAKSEFLATMSHEIRTPMNGVIGLAGLLLDTALDDEQRRYASGVRGAGEALLGIIDDILDLSKLEAAKVELEELPVDPRLLLEEVGLLLAGAAAGRHLELLTFCEPGVPAVLLGDAGRLRQVLINLTSNAVKFTEQGEVLLRAGLRSLDDGRAVVEFSVSDTGIGIDPAVQGRLFEPFAQADASTTRRFGGTGLGLAICRRLVTAMQGELNVTSAVGEGSTFRFAVPLRVASPAPAAPAPQQSRLRGRRVLVVDDNPTNRLILVTQLASWDVDADTVGDAETAWQMLQEARGQGRPYDVAVLDMCMPEVDGLELAARMAADPALVEVGTMMLTSAGRLPSAALAQAGVEVCVSKPVRSADLHDALLQLCAVGDVPSPHETGESDAPPVAPVLGRVLVVEDNELNQVVAEGLLRQLGYEVQLVDDGRQALQALGAQRFGAVLMDGHMPGMDGYEATRELRRREGAGRRTPVIAMTASVLAEDRARCTAAGMDDFVSKPVDAEQLGRTLSRWIGAGAPAGPGLPSAPPVGVGELLDHARLEVLRGIGPDDGWGMLPAVVEAFVQAAAGHGGAVRAAVGSQDVEALAGALHRLRGSAANLGVTAVAACCADLEARVRGGGLPVEADLDRLDVVLASSCASLSALRAARST